MKKVFIITGIVAIAAALIFFRNDIQAAVALSFTDKNKKETKYVQEPASPGITIAGKWKLPEVLTEISGLGYIDKDRFACVQDELGKVFIYNTATSSIEAEIPFAGTGDYEGITMVNETAWVVRSDGRLFEVNNIKTPKPVVKEYDTPLTAAQNVEGLCYDRKNNRLLLAIKDAEPGNVNYKGVYSFDLATRKMQAAPAFKIDLSHSLLAKGSSEKQKGGIKPSALGIHPVTGDIYITDGPGSKLLVTDAKGVIKTLYKLSDDEFMQPEGITFKPDGQLFISNEGKKQAGSIISITIDAG